MEEISSGQKKEIYKLFDEYWTGFKKHNILSRFIMHWMDRSIEKILLDLSPDNILDVGCGIGRTISKFRKLGFKATGIDNSTASINFCEKLGYEKNKDCFKMDAADMDFPDRSFDVVFSEGLLEHFEDYDSFIKEMIRVSRKYVLLIQPNFHSIAGKILNIATRILRKRDPNEFPYKTSDYIKSFEEYRCNLALKKSAVFGAFTIFLFKI